MSARQAAIQQIARQAKRFPDLELPSRNDSEDAGLDARDAALASAIEHAVLRRWLTLRAVLQRSLSRPWEEVESPLQAALLCGAAQLLLMDRLPDYAVINETVAWAKRAIREKAGGFVNAVLRKVAAARASTDLPSVATPLEANQLPLSDGRVMTLNAEAFASDPLVRAAEQTSHPVTLLEHWVGLYGKAQAMKLAAHSLVHAPIIVHGLSESAPASEPALAAHEEPGFFVLDHAGDGKGSANIRWLLERNASAIVQDPASAAAVRECCELDPPPRVVIDACAGRGTKTRQLAANFPEAAIIATDVDAHRLASLRAMFAGSPTVSVVEPRALRSHLGQADLLLLDVPCSNSGVLARRVEAKYRFTRDRLSSVVDLQRQIVADSIPLLSERGRILYVTCSIDRAENQSQAEWISRWHRMTIMRSDARLPKGLPGEPPRQYRDGGFWALLGRNA